MATDGLQSEYTPRGMRLSLLVTLVDICFQLIAADLLTFLHRNESYQQILLHGFSVGGYMWGEVLDLIQDDKEKYTSIKDKIVGHVWDSAADVNEIPIGMPRALFPNNIVMQILLRKYIE